MSTSSVVQRAVVPLPVSHPPMASRRVFFIYLNKYKTTWFRRMRYYSERRVVSALYAWRHLHNSISGSRPLVVFWTAHWAQLGDKPGACQPIHARRRPWTWNGRTNVLFFLHIDRHLNKKLCLNKKKLKSNRELFSIRTCLMMYVWENVSKGRSSLSICIPRNTQCDVTVEGWLFITLSLNKDTHKQEETNKQDGG